MCNFPGLPKAAQRPPKLSPDRRSLVQHALAAPDSFLELSPRQPLPQSSRNRQRPVDRGLEGQHVPGLVDLQRQRLDLVHLRPTVLTVLDELRGQSPQPLFQRIDRCGMRPEPVPLHGHLQRFDGPLNVRKCSRVGHQVVVGLAHHGFEIVILQPVVAHVVDNDLPIVRGRCQHTACSSCGGGKKTMHRLPGVAMPLELSFEDGLFGQRQTGATREDVKQATHEGPSPRLSVVPGLQTDGHGLSQRRGP